MGTLTHGERCPLGRRLAPHNRSDADGLKYRHCGVAVEPGGIKPRSGTNCQNRRVACHQMKNLMRLCN